MSFHYLIFQTLGLEEWFTPPQTTDVEPCDFHVFGTTTIYSLAFRGAQELFVVQGNFFAPHHQSHKILVYSPMFQLFCYLQTILTLDCIHQTFTQRQIQIYWVGGELKGLISPPPSNHTLDKTEYWHSV